MVSRMGCPLTTVWLVLPRSETHSVSSGLKKTRHWKRETAGSVSSMSFWEDRPMRAPASGTVRRRPCSGPLSITRWMVGSVLMV